MQSSTRTILNDPGLLAARDAHFARLESAFAGSCPEPPLYVHGVFGNPGAGRPDAPDPYTEPEAWVHGALDSLAAQANLLRDPVVFRPLCLEFGPFGVHYIDRMLGARVYRGPEGQWWVSCLDSPVGCLEPPDLETDPTWALSRRMARAFVEAGVSVPLFGMPTIASALNIAVNLYGPRLLIAFIEDPRAVRHDLTVINDLLCTLHRWYRQNIPEAQLQPVVAAERCQPPGHGQLCGCTTHLISAAMYEEFVAPLDGALLSDYPKGGMIHLCGAHTQHIPVWRQMECLRAVQLNDRAAEDFEAYFTGLRDDQVLYVIPTGTMTPERILALSGGRRVVLIGEPAPSLGSSRPPGAE